MIRVISISLFLLTSWFSSAQAEVVNTGLLAPKEGDTSEIIKFVGNKSMDAHFVESMIAYHKGIANIAKVALEHAESPDVIELAGNIARADEDEIIKMYRWVAFKIIEESLLLSSEKENPGIRMAVYHHSENNLQRPVNVRFDTGGDADFVRAMISHHQSAIETAKSALDKSEDIEVIRLAEMILESHGEKIMTMYRWLWARDLEY